jgi:hypothetical protein
MKKHNFIPGNRARAEATDVDESGMPIHIEGYKSL